ncbi:DUF998 domain-containing protein [Cohnella caldifontis]|uniref:DUF998 domain-containing protein n=1 Tax=Cohnella caldifontis TaxID=3027471 RepID=UPI0023ED6704|nr:DUF998 domain-containing protein [Cohnella sp. YIM B05605]
MKKQWVNEAALEVGRQSGHRGAVKESLRGKSANGIALGLKCGIAAGPLYVAVGTIQALTREGFDIRRHALSLLSNGDLGWIQISNFLLSAVLVLAFAVAAGRTFARGTGGLWGPLLIGGYGLGLFGAGMFVADPALGFPVGAPEGSPEQTSFSGLMHFVCGGFGFLCLIAACLAFARRFFRSNRKGWGLYSAATGVLFFAAFAGISSGNAHPALNIAFSAAVVLGWTWISSLAWQLLKHGR